MPDNQTDDVRAQLHDALYRMLIDKVRHDRYPSATMMNMVEAGLDERRLRAYAQVLLDKVGDDQFPSIDMLKRLTNLL
ncbi:MAG: hypothetical protein QOH52_4530 [Pseudonocardiales bacterium]|jgi:hypothetical protein|nr:hypothetical protein [Pseudonocardiales bacterium]